MVKQCLHPHKWTFIENISQMYYSTACQRQINFYTEPIMKHLVFGLCLSTAYYGCGKPTTSASSTSVQLKPYSLADKSTQEILEHSDRLLETATVYEIHSINKENILVYEQRYFSESFNKNKHEYLFLPDVQSLSAEDAQKCFLCLCYGFHTQ